MQERYRGLPVHFRWQRDCKTLLSAKIYIIPRNRAMFDDQYVQYMLQKNYITVFNTKLLLDSFNNNSSVIGITKLVELPRPSDRCRLFQGVCGSPESSSSFLEHTERRHLQRYSPYLLNFQNNNNLYRENLGGNSQNFLRQICKIFVTFRFTKQLPIENK